MIVKFYDTSLKLEITQFEVPSLADVPLVGDDVILVCSEEYALRYGYSDRSGSVQIRNIDYRGNTVVIFMD